MHIFTPNTNSTFFSAVRATSCSGDASTHGDATFFDDDEEDEVDDAEEEEGEADLAFPLFFFLVGERPRFSSLFAGAALWECLKGQESPFLHVPVAKNLHGMSFVLRFGDSERLEEPERLPPFRLPFPPGVPGEFSRLGEDDRTCGYLQPGRLHLPVLWNS